MDDSTFAAAASSAASAITLTLSTLKLVRGSPEAVGLSLWLGGTIWLQCGLAHSTPCASLRVGKWESSYVLSPCFSTCVITLTPTLTLTQAVFIPTTRETVDVSIAHRAGGLQPRQP